jgi:hypothetical protein
MTVRSRGNAPDDRKFATYSTFSRCRSVDTAGRTCPGSRWQTKRLLNAAHLWIPTRSLAISKGHLRRTLRSTGPLQSLSGRLSVRQPMGGAEYLADERFSRGVEQVCPSRVRPPGRPLSPFWRVNQAHPAGDLSRTWKKHGSSKRRQAAPLLSILSSMSSI